MNKILIILLLFCISIFAQYGNNLVVDGGLETFTGTADDGTDDDWTNWAEASTSGIVEASTVFHSGTYSAILHNNTGAAFTNVAINKTGAFSITLLQSKLYRYTFWTRGDGGGRSGTYRLYDAANATNIVQTTSGITSASFTKIIYNFTTAANFTNLNAYLYGTATNGDSIFYDDVVLRQKLDTLFVASIGDDTDADTVETLTEAFTTRGVHSSGTFILLAGTYDESITIDSSCTAIMTNGGEVTITAVNFNSKTLSLDNGIKILTATNMGNVTIDYSNYSEYITTGYPKYLNYTSKRRNW